MSGNDQPRVPAGRRDGGRFAAADSDVRVDDLAPEPAANRGGATPGRAAEILFPVGIRGDNDVQAELRELAPGVFAKAFADRPDIGVWPGGRDGVATFDSSKLGGDVTVEARNHADPMGSGRDCLDVLYSDGGELEYMRYDIGGDPAKGLAKAARDIEARLEPFMRRERERVWDAVERVMDSGEVAGGLVTYRNEVGPNGDVAYRPLVSLDGGATDAERGDAARRVYEAMLDAVADMGRNGWRSLRPVYPEIARKNGR